MRKLSKEEILGEKRKWNAKSGNGFYSDRGSEESSSEVAQRRGA